MAIEQNINENNPTDLTEEIENTEISAEATEEKQEKTSEIENEIAQLRQALTQAEDKALRMAAEAQNTRKRAEKEIIDAKNYALSNFAKEILTVCDSLERSLDATKNYNEENSNVLQSLTSGVEMTLNMLMKCLANYKISKITAEIGAKFDPHLHQAMFEQEPQEEQEPGTIASVIQDGYMISERVLRPTLVGIIKKS